MGGIFLAHIAAMNCMQPTTFWQSSQYIITDLYGGITVDDLHSDSEWNGMK